MLPALWAARWISTFSRDATSGQAVEGVAHAAAVGAGGSQPVFLHLVPRGFSGEGPGDRLECIVQAVEHEVFGGVEQAFGLAAAQRVLEHVRERRPVVGAPDEG